MVSVVPFENVTTSSSDDSEVETVVHVSLQKSAQTKRPPSLGIICDQDPELNQEQTTYGEEESIHSFPPPHSVEPFDWFWYYVAKCPDA